MGFVIEMANADPAGKTVTLNRRRPVGLVLSIQPESTIRDLRHPNPVRPVVSSPKNGLRAPTRVDRHGLATPGGPLSLPTVPLARTDAQDQRIVVED